MNDRRCANRANIYVCDMPYGHDGDHNQDGVLWRNQPVMTKESAMSDTVASHLNAALEAVYTNIGPSPVLVEIRAAMALLGVEETQRTKVTGDE